MGLWIKNADGTIEKAAGGGGGGGPHNHAEYLPLEGGTLSGDLVVDGVASLQSFGVELEVGCYGIEGHAGNPAFSSVLDPTTGMYVSSPGRLHFTLAGTDALHMNEYGMYLARTVYGVDGTSSYPGFSFNSAPNTGFYLVAAGTSGVAGDLQVDGYMQAATFRITSPPETSAQPNTYVDATGYLFRTDWTPSRMAFAPSKLTRDSDVLERAETATLPPEIKTDEDGNQTNTAEVEAHDTVELFDVVTALLAKVKQLSAEIEELKKGA